MITTTATETTEHTDSTDTYYLTREEAARMLDAYGSLTVVQKKRRTATGGLRVYYHPRWRIVDKNLDVLVLLQAQFGGSIYHHSGRHYSWEIAQTTLGALLEETLPYMQEKRPQAEPILQLIEAKENGTTATRKTRRRFSSSISRLRRDMGKRRLEG